MHGLNDLSPERRKQAFNVVKVNDKLLRMQLDAPTRELRPSMNKLLAQDKIVIKKGHRDPLPPKDRFLRQGQAGLGRAGECGERESRGGRDAGKGFFQYKLRWF